MNYVTDKTFEVLDVVLKSGTRKVRTCTYWHDSGYTVATRYYRKGETDPFRTIYYHGS